MLFRFSLYGFLKNQRYFEPFLVLVFLEKGLGFAEIGLLVGIRELTVNFLEIPSGAVADVRGRRQAMIFSFVAYIVSFGTFGYADGFGWLAMAMVLFGVGESFRTGTHKAMIFTWLRIQGRTDERAKVYGFTRSWSKIGSAVSVIIGAGLVVATDRFSYLFWVAAIPYLLNIVNLLGYPAELDREPDDGHGDRRFLGHVRDSVKEAFRVRRLRRLLLESMGFEGVFHAVKDYLQPVLQVAAVTAGAGLALSADLSAEDRTAVLVALVYAVLFALSGAASRRAHVVSQRAGGDDPAAHRLWGFTAVAFALIAVSGWFDFMWVVIGSFVVLHVIQNLWRPVLISRIDAHAAAVRGATVLSIESQVRRTATMVLAPVLGVAVDAARRAPVGGDFWPIGVAGFAVAVTFFVVSLRTTGTVRAR